ncbi:MAG TPA: ParB N-terminal domain-containing protein [Candidatus Polarisedimenticolaceae bacterium]|nr:ParB N-terminal domain-containing protein [Candidatus Polarisedimenticolaceae bacterium]
MAALAEAVAADGGRVLAIYREPLGGNWQLFAALPLDRVQPTPFQRDLSAPHVARLAAAIDQLDRFVDPIVAVRTDEAVYWTPNGHHRTAALKQLGARSIVALVLPDPAVAYRILALNTEKAHNLRERSLEVIRMARDLAERERRRESEYAPEFEEPALVTLGLCYEQRGRFAGGAYHPVLRRIDAWIDEPLPRALDARSARAARLLELEDAVADAIAALKERGLESPYLRAFVVARINPLRFQRGKTAEIDATLERMLASARRFDAGKVKLGQLARSGGAPEE